MGGELFPPPLNLFFERQFKRLKKKIEDFFCSGFLSKCKYRTVRNCARLSDRKFSTILEQCFSAFFDRLRHIFNMFTFNLQFCMV